METPTVDLLGRIEALEREVSELRKKIENAQSPQPTTALDMMIGTINRRIRWAIECGEKETVEWFGRVKDGIDEHFVSLIIDRISKQGLLEVKYDGSKLRMRWGPDYVPV